MACLSACAAQAQTTARDYFERGVAHEKAGDLAAARSAYEQVLALEPSRVDAQGNLGMVLLRMGQAAPAAERFEKVLAAKPDMAQVRFFLALARYQANEFERAAAELARFLEAKPRDARALHLRAMCLLKLDRLEEGAGSLEQAIEADPSNGAALVTLATTYISLGELDRAEALLRDRLAGRDIAETKLVRGMLLNARGHYREAEGVLAAAAEANPKLPTVRNQLGYTRMLLGDYPAAVREFEAELRLNPHDFNASANLAWILAQDRDFERAAPLLVTALAQRPANAGLQYLMGQVWLARNDLAKAAEAMERAVALKPEFRAAHVLLARVYAKQNRAQDLARQTALIAKLNNDEQERSAASHESYGGNAAPVGFAAGKSAESRTQ